MYLIIIIYHLATANALKTLGVTINKIKNSWEVYGQGIGNFYGNSHTLDMGNSGTAARLLMGIIAGSDVEATFMGDESLSKRPMRRVILPLLKTGAMFREPEKSTLPLTLKGSKIPLPLTYKSPVSSAQIKSCILLALPAMVPIVAPMKFSAAIICLAVARSPPVIHVQYMYSDNVYNV